MAGTGGEDLQLGREERQLAAVEIPLGPHPRVFEKVVGGLVGVPIGVGLVLPPHGLLIGIGGAVFAAYLVGATVIALARAKRFGTENNVAVGALGRGELATAHEVFARWAPSRNPVVSGMARHNLGWTLMLEGRLEEAARILDDTAEHYQRGLIRIGLLPTTRLDVGLCNALLGKLDVAEAWYRKAEEPVKAPPRPGFGGMMALLRAVIDCRSTRAAEAAVLLERAWAEHEAVLSGEMLRMLRVMRAFACAVAAGPRSQGVVERVLGDMKPRYEGELAFLGGTWPEMAAFLAAHRLDA